MGWWEERTGLGAWRQSLAARLSRPLPARALGISLSAVAMFFILVQMATGGLLAVYYVPSWKEGHDSVFRIVTEIPFGWLIRSVHVWAAHLLVAVAILHMIRGFARASYEKPREATWLAGVALLMILLTAAFTGQVLPLDQEGVNGAEVAAAFSDIFKLGPIVRGGEAVGTNTVGRVFAVHAVFVPLSLILLVAAHIALVARHRLKGAEHVEGTSPTYLRAAGMSLLFAMALLAFLAIVFPPGVGPRGDFSSGDNVKPLWVFLPMYQALKIVPGGMGVLVLTLPVALLIGIPFITRRRTAVGLATAAFVIAVALGVWGALS